MPMLIIMYLFKCLSCRGSLPLQQHGPEPIDNLVLRGAYAVPVGILFPSINFTIIPFSPFCLSLSISAAVQCISSGWKGRAAASAARVSQLPIRHWGTDRLQVADPLHQPTQHSCSFPPGPLCCPKLPHTSPSLLPCLTQQTVPAAATALRKMEKQTGAAGNTSFQWFQQSGVGSSLPCWGFSHLHVCSVGIGVMEAKTTLLPLRWETPAAHISQQHGYGTHGLNPDFCRDELVG